MRQTIHNILELAWQFNSKGLDGTCCTDLSLAELRALQTVVLRPECPVQDIGKALNFTKSGATRIVNRLEKKELVEKQRSKEDGRICCVTATLKGTDALNEAMQNTSNQLEKTLSNLTEEDKNSIADALHLLVEKLKG